MARLSPVRDDRCHCYGDNPEMNRFRDLILVSLKIIFFFLVFLGGFTAALAYGFGESLANVRVDAM
jgi:hypothetical protein